MASDMQAPDNDKESRETFIKLAQQIAAYEPNTLIRKGTDFDFVAGQGVFEQIQSFFAQVQATPWNHVPIEVILEAFAPMGRLKQYLERIKTFSAKGATSPELARNQNLEHLDSEWRDCYSKLVAHLVFESAGGGPGEILVGFRWAVADDTKQIQTDQQEVMQLALATQKELGSILQSANGVLAQVQDTGRQIVVTKQASHFKKLANWYVLFSIIWLGAAVVVGVGTYKYLENFTAAPLMGSQPVTPPAAPSSAATQPDYAAIIRTMLPRLITVTVLLTALVFCLRNFSAMLHNQVVNRHRQTALMTFQTFVSSTEQPEVKSAVLLQATQAIFSPQPSGYLKGENEIPQVNQINEIVRGFAGKGEK